ncbi:mitogen-activated protein kinase kinase kinase 15 isoform X2 [Centruroides vittatus]|uniref:mitogen-activated protein kinase kinase kinase 15 isoform X2 n=1 Tax=Centruroides vittatus TaxID=120091 RepID=UPI00350F4B18
MSDADVKSVSSHHSHSRSKMDVVCLLDLVITENLKQRQAAYEEIQKVCHAIGASLQHIQYQKLEFCEGNVLDLFYNADVLIVDISITDQKSSLIYHLGVRESFNMTQNILLYNDIDSTSSLSLKLSCQNYKLITYKLNDLGVCVETDPAGLRLVPDDVLESKHLSCKLKKLLQEVELQSKAHMKEKFISDLRSIKKNFTGEELAQELQKMRKRLDDPNIISGEVVTNMLLLYRDIQDYDAMVTLVDELQTIPNIKFTFTLHIQFHYAFALNRRKKEGDQEKALDVINKVLTKKENHLPDILCLCGRIYKDKFVDSDYSDKESLENAIYWYRKGFEVKPNEYAGVNLATLLVVAGNDLSNSVELQQIGMMLNHLIGRKGSLSSLQDYWDVATFFEISVLAEEYVKAIQAAECMFKLKPPNWYLKSTIGNLQLINLFRKKTDAAKLKPEEQVFNFWVDYFQDATLDDVSDIIRFPILISEPTEIYMPSYVTVNMGADVKSIQIYNICIETLKGKCHNLHEWIFQASSIKSVSLYKRDERCLFLYVHQNSDDFQMFFPSELLRNKFHKLLLEMTADQEGMVTDLDTDITNGPIQFEYEVDEQNKKILLGKGTYGSVYAARDLNTQIKVAVKEILEKNIGVVQPLHEEIKLHSQLRHRNIVQYLGSVSEDGYFKIFMEQVPGGSLSQLLRSKWGPLKDNEATIAFYTKQILEGLKYLHDQKIVHRDIKGDNVLVNTYSGIVKISDFGTSKRLVGVNRATETFTGTLQYMAPEVIDKGFRGYGAPADIWSLGCTIVEMATGKPPFVELGSAEAAMFKVGYFKQHPEIPESMSDKAKQFILRCFEPDPDKRATAAELLEEPFLVDVGRKKKAHRPLGPDFPRSISVPAERNFRLEKPDRVGRFASTGDEGSEGSDCTINGSMRRSSSGMLSPPVDGPQTEQDQGGFYMLKKDSQRRITLIKVLTDHVERICDIWMKSLVSHIPNVSLTVDNLHVLINGLRDFIPEQNKASIQQAINHLKDILEFDKNTIHQIQLSLYLFNEAVNNVLRDQSIKPHWIFALDSLIRTAVKTAIIVLSPELGQDFDDHEHDDPEHEEGSTSGVSSTINSVRSQHGAQAFNCSRYVQLQQQLSILEEENMKLMQELVESQVAYQDLLKHTLNDKKNQMMLLQKRIYPNEVDTAACLADRQLIPSVTVSGENSGDEELTDWLRSLSLDEDSIKKFIEEDYTKDDVLNLMSREDLRRLGLKGGMELRVWKAISNHREGKT